MSFIYMISTVVFDLTPAVVSLTFKFWLRILLRTRAVFILMESEKPSFEPLMTFSESVSFTPRLGYPLSPIFKA